MNHINIIKQVERDATSKSDPKLYENIALRQWVQQLCNDLAQYQQPDQGTYIDLTSNNIKVRVFFDHIPEQKATPADPPFAAVVQVIAVCIAGVDILDLMDKNLVKQMERMILDRING
jgi:hypothetical protein